MFKRKPIVTAIALSLGSPLASADLTTGLVAYYPFTGNANDASGNGNNGTVNGATLTADRNGNANSAYNFNGSSTIRVVSSPTLNFGTSDFSMSMRIKPTGQFCQIIGKDSYGGGGYYAGYFLQLYENDRKVRFGIRNTATNMEAYLDSPTTLQQGDWVYLTAVRKSDTLELYINGTIDSSVGHSNPDISNNVDFKIGRFDEGGQPSFYGDIDDIRIYNRALSATEVQQLYQQGTQQATTTTLTSSLNPAPLSQNLTFTAKVAATPTPSGSLTFKVDGVAKSTGNLSTGQLTYATAALTAGAHTIRAEYAGTTTFAPSVAQLTQTVTGKPDFYVTNVTLTPAVPASSSTFSAAVTVQNSGAGDGGQLRLWANQPTAQTCAASGGDKTVAVGTVAAGASKTFTVAGLSAGASGAKILRAFVDAACTVAETNEANNQLVKGYMVKDLRADFVVTALTLTPASPAANNLFTLNVTIKNQGAAARSAGYLDVWLHQPTAQTCGADGDAWQDLGSLAAGASKTLTFSLAAPNAGAKTLRAYADSWCETVEANEGNNQLTKAYTVQ